MIVLGLSNFAPTARFGYVMAALMVASLYGEVILLPALLCIGRRKKSDPQSDARDSAQAVNYEIPEPPVQLTGKVA